MTATRDPDRLIEAFLSEGGTELPDRTYHAVRAHIDRTRQRVVIGSWREPDMPNVALVAIAAAAVLAIGVAGINLLAGRDAVGGPDASPTAGPTGTASPRRANDFEQMVPGRYVIRGPSSTMVPAGWPKATVTATLPAGWTQNSGARGAGIYRGGLATINFGAVGNVLADPCRSQAVLEPPLGPTMDDLAAAVAGIPGVDATEPEDATLDGYGGKRIQVTLPSGLSDCEFFPLWETPGPDEMWTVASPQGWIHRLLILDIDGVRFVVDAASAPEASSEIQGELDQIVSSIDFGPMSGDQP